MASRYSHLKFYCNLQKYRSYHSLTQQSLALLIGCTVSTIVRIEKKHTVFTPVLLNRVLLLFNISFSQLYTATL